MANNANAPDSAVPALNETRWHSRRFAAWLLRAGIVVAPVIAAVIVMAVVSRAVPRPRSGSLTLVIGWWALVLASSLVTLLAADRVARRLTPLAALLDLAVLFPGRAPTRFAIARKAGDLRALKTLSETVLPGQQPGNLATAAEQILALVGSLRAHDRHTRGHSERVRVYTDMIAAELRLPTAAVDRLRWAALLHDIGKLRIPASVLNKPAKLSRSEWEAIRRHPDAGAELAADLLPWLGQWGLAIAEHHEHFDGTGYPRGLSGTNISLAGRVVAVADSFETMTAARPYKRARTRAGGLEELVRYSGKQFDPDVVRALLAVSAPKLAWAMGPASWLTGLPFIGSAPSMTGAGLAAQAATGVAGVAAASVAGVAVAAVPAASTPQPIAAAASHAAVGSHSAASRPSGSPGAGRNSTPAPTAGGHTTTSTHAVSAGAAGKTSKPTSRQSPGRQPGRRAAPRRPRKRRPTHRPGKQRSARRPLKRRPDAAVRESNGQPPAVRESNCRTDATATATPTPKPTPTPTPTPGPPAPGGVQVNYRNANVLPLATQLMPQIEVVNTGTKPIDLAAVTVRYWFTEDGNAALKYTCTYAASGCGSITATFAQTGGHNADHYLQLQLSGTLAPGASTGLIQQQITKANISIFDQTNDYSYGANTATQSSTHITAYSGSTLIWGTEPSGFAGPDRSGGFTAPGGQ